MEVLNTEKLSIKAVVNQICYFCWSIFWICSLRDRFVNLFLMNRSCSSCLNYKRYFLNFVGFFILRVYR